MSSSSELELPSILEVSFSRMQWANAFVGSQGLCFIMNPENVQRFLAIAEHHREIGGKMSVEIDTKGSIEIFLGERPFVIPKSRLIDPLTTMMKDKQHMVAWALHNIRKHGKKLGWT